MGYNVTSTKLAFLKKGFSPRWRFFIHTILHCLRQKKTSWEQFSGNMAAALICLATNKKFNFSKYIFEGLVKNVDSETKFLMYPRFIQCLINKSKHVFLPPTKPFKTPKLTHKVFSNMKIGFHGEEVPLFEEMLPPYSEEPSTSTAHSSSVPSVSPPSSVPSVTQPSPVPLPSQQPTQTPSLSHHNSPPHSPPHQSIDAQTVKDLKEQVQHLQTSLENQHKHFTEVNTKLVKRVEKLELKVKLLKGKGTSQLAVSSSSSSGAEGLGLSSKKGRMGSLGSSEHEEEIQFHEGIQVVDEEPAIQEKGPVYAKDTAEAEQEPAGIQRLLAMELKGSDQMF
jgi:hypothetical protein